MNIYDTRQANLDTLITEVCEKDGHITKRGRIKLFTIRHPSIGDERYVANLRRGTQHIGYNKARTIERACGKPEDWLDHMHQPPPVVK